MTQCSGNPLTQELIHGTRRGGTGSYSSIEILVGTKTCWSEIGGACRLRQLFDKTSQLCLIVSFETQSRSRDWKVPSNLACVLTRRRVHSVLAQKRELQLTTRARRLIAFWMLYRTLNDTNDEDELEKDKRSHSWYEKTDEQRWQEGCTLNPNATTLCVRACPGAFKLATLHRAPLMR